MTGVQTCALPILPDFEDLDKVLPLLRQAIDELDKSESGSV